MVMLHGDPAGRREPLDRVLGREVLGVEVVDDDLGLEREQPRQVGEPVGERPVGREILEIAVVRRDVGASAASQRERVLELGAHREQRCRRGQGQVDRVRGVAAGAPDDGLAARDDARDRVVVPRPDLAVVDQEAVGETRQAGQRVGVVGGQRLVGQVAGGEHDRPADVRHEHVVERRIGQEHAQPAVARGHGLGEGRGRPGPGIAPGLEEHDRSRRACQQAAFGRPDPAQGPRGAEVPDHDRERLRPAPLAIPEPHHGLLARRVAGELVATQALDRDDPAVEQQAHGGGQGLVARGDRTGSARRPPGEAGSAVRAGDRLRVEPAIRGIPVLGVARRAQREGPHRGLRSVVRQLVDDRGPGPAVGAVGERIAVAPVCRVAQLGQARVAGRDVGREQPVGARRTNALDDLERPGQRTAVGAQVARRDAFHAGARRGIGPQPSGQRIEGGRCPGSLDLDAAGRVPDPPGQVQLGGQAPHERSEADALDHALDDESASASPVADGRDAHVRMDGCSHGSSVGPTALRSMSRTARNSDRRSAGRTPSPARRSRPAFLARVPRVPS